MEVDVKASLEAILTDTDLIPDRIVSFKFSKDAMLLVGEIAAHWTLVEKQTQLLLGEVLSVQGTAGQCVSTHIPTGTIFDIIESLLDDEYHSKIISNRCSSIRKQFDTLRNERNKLVHGTYVEKTETNEAYIFNIKARKKREFSMTPFDQEMCKLLISDFVRLFWRLTHFQAVIHMAKKFGVDSLPTPLPDKHPEMTFRTSSAKR